MTGRASAAERDVLENARRRWPAVRFDVREVAVQGHLAVEQVIGALRCARRAPEVDVIVLARGGGSVEDLLPFSDEALCRAVAACRTPVVSAIGHEPDSPLVDLVADVRCSTPTDAGKRVVPDVGEELTRVHRCATAPSGSSPGRSSASGPACRRPQPAGARRPARARHPPRRRGRRRCATGPAAAPARRSRRPSATSSTPSPASSR